MTKSQKNIYIGIRAEQIKEFQDKNNGHLFKQPYSIETAKQIAEQQLENDLERGNFRITIEELLLCDNETCIETVNNKTIELAKKLK